MQTIELLSAIDRLASEGAWDFDDTSDYFWKAPTLIEHETEIEKAKLETYFPDNTSDRRLRWRLESRKLEKLFPFLISTGNVYTIVSLLEIYLLRFCLMIQPNSGPYLRDAKGQGISRSSNFLQRIGIEITHIRLWTQVDAALTIRNCLMHASGFLMHSRDDKEIRRILKSGVFLIPEHRKNRDIIQIVETDLGDQLQIANKYPWLLCVYFRDFFFDICELAKANPLGAATSDQDRRRPAK